MEPPNATPETPATPPTVRGKDEVALELMKFVAITTGYGKSPQAGTGFSAKPSTRTPEEHAEALLELYDRCRKIVNQDA